MWGLTKKALNSTVGSGMKTLDKISEQIGVNSVYDLISAINLSAPNNKIFVAPRKKVLSGIATNIDELQFVAISSETEEIGEAFFFDCRELQDINIPCVKTIGEGAFESSGLKSIVLGTDLVEIGAVAFQGCERLTDIFYRGTKYQWDKVYKGQNWDYYTNEYTVHCYDGDITKSRDS